MPLHSSPAPSIAPSTSSHQRRRAPLENKTNSPSASVRSHPSARSSRPSQSKPVLKESRVSDDGKGALAVDMIRSMREGSTGGDDGKLKAPSRSRSRSKSLTPAPYEEPRLPSGVGGRMSRSVSPAVIVEEAGPTKREDREYDEEEEAARNLEAERRRRKRTRELSVPLEEIEEGLRRDEERDKAKRGRKEGSSRSAAESDLPRDGSFGVGEEEQKMMDELDHGATDLARGQEDFEMALRDEEEEGMPQEEDFAFQNDVFGFGLAEKHLKSNLALPIFKPRTPKSTVPTKTTSALSSLPPTPPTPTEPLPDPLSDPDALEAIINPKSASKKKAAAAAAKAKKSASADKKKPSVTKTKARSSGRRAKTSNPGTRRKGGMTTRRTSGEMSDDEQEEESELEEEIDEYDELPGPQMTKDSAKGKASARRGKEKVTTTNGNSATKAKPRARLAVGSGSKLTPPEASSSARQLSPPSPHPPLSPPPPTTSKPYTLCHREKRMEAAADPNSKATLLNPNVGTGAPDGVDRGKRKEAKKAEAAAKQPPSASRSPSLTPPPPVAFPSLATNPIPSEPNTSSSFKTLSAKQQRAPPASTFSASSSSTPRPTRSTRSNPASNLQIATSATASRRAAHSSPPPAPGPSSDLLVMQQPSAAKGKEAAQDGVREDREDTDDSDDLYAD